MEKNSQNNQAPSKPKHQTATTLLVAIAITAAIVGILVAIAIGVS